MKRLFLLLLSILLLAPLAHAGNLSLAPFTLDWSGGGKIKPSTIFNGYDFTGGTFTNSAKVVVDYLGEYQTSPANKPAIYGGRFVNAVDEGATLGSEVTTNGTFATDTWWTKSGGATISDGTGNLSGVSSLERGSLLSLNTRYYVVYTATIRAGSVRTQLGGAQGITHRTSGTYAEEIVATGFTLYFVGVVGSDVSIDNVSVKPIINSWRDDKPSGNISCWGDSLTAKQYPYYLGKLNPGIPTYNGGVGGETSTQIKTRLLAATDKLGDVTIIWAGANNVDAEPNTVISDIAEMVAALATDKYLVLSVIGTDSATIGSGYHTDIQTVNNALSSTYGNKYVNIHQVLLDNYDPENPQDVLDIANDITPSSLRIDNIHLTAEGYEIVANAIQSALSLNGIVPSRVPIWGPENVCATKNGSFKRYTANGRYLVEPDRTNYFLNSTVPANQSISLTTGTFTLSVTGDGSVACAAGTATGTGFGSASSGAPVVMTITGAGTIDCTVTDTPSYVQVENGAYATSPIVTGGVASSRTRDILSYPVNNRIKSNDFGFTIKITPLAAGQNQAVMFSSQTDGTHFISLFTTATKIYLNKYIAGSNSCELTYTHAANETIEIQGYVTSTIGAGIRYRKYTSGAWSAWSAWGTNSNTTEAPIGTTYQIGARDGGSQFYGIYSELATWFIPAGRNPQQFMNAAK